MANFRLQRVLHNSISGATGATVRKGAVSLLDQAVVSGTNFLTGVIVGRTVAKEEFGLYLLGFTILMFVVNAQASLITTPYTVYGPRLGSRERARYAGNTAVQQLALSLLAAVFLALVAAVLWGAVGSKGLARVVGALSLAVGFVLVREIRYRRVCFAHMRPKAALSVDLCVAAVQLGGLLMLSAAGVITASRAFLIAGLACCVASAAGFFSVRRFFAGGTGRARSDLVRNWMLGRWMLASTIAAMAGAELYPWFVAAFHGTAATGALGACRGVVFLANPFLMGLTNFLGPKAAHARAEGNDNLDRMVIVATAVVSAATCAFFVFVLFLGGPLLGFLYGSQYAGYGGVVVILALRLLVGAIDLPVNCALLATERADAVFKSYLVGGAVTMAIGVPLVHAFGLVGAVWGMVGTTAATAGYRIWTYWLKAGEERDALTNQQC